jgi:hypothetical protein
MKKLIFSMITIVIILAFFSCVKECPKCECTPTGGGTKDTTVSFQPDSSGIDSYIVATQSCVAGASAANSANGNQGNLDYLAAIAWTFNNNGCATGQFRSLIKFASVSNIPSTATIISAKLSLYGVNNNNSSISPLIPNSTYPGSPYTSFGSNDTWLYRITSPWSENTLTWNNQPAFSTNTAIGISASTSKFDFNATDIDVTALVKEMIIPANGNYGFLLKLRDETYYRAINFASSDNATASLRPKLVINYKY